LVKRLIAVCTKTRVQIMIRLHTAKYDSTPARPLMRNRSHLLH